MKNNNFILLILLAGILFSGCRLFQPSKLLRTGKDFVYDQITNDSISSEYKIAPDDIFKSELITPAQAEKLLPKDRKGLIDTLTSRISSGLTLARDKGLSQ